MAKMLIVWFCLWAAAVGVAPPAVMPPARPAALPSSAATAQMPRSNIGMVEAPAANAVIQAQLAPRLRGQPATPADSSWKITEAALTDTSGRTPVGVDEMLRATRAEGSDYRHASQSSNAPTTAMTSSLGALALAVMAAVVTIGRWWSRRADAMQNKESATEMIDSSASVSYEQPKLAVAALASEEPFDPIHLKNDGRRKSLDSEIRHGRQVLLEASFAGRTAAQLVGTGRSLSMQRAAVQESVAVKEKKDLTGRLPDCPKTIWNADNIDIDKLTKVEETAPLVVDAKELSDALAGKTEQQYFATQCNEIMDKLQRHGAILFRNFDLMQNAEGFREFYELLKLNPCLDPIHTSGLREMVGKKDAVYEAVNKPSLAQHFVGLHNESTFVKTAMFGAFVCFKPASEGGGEFLIADGAAIINDMDKDVLKRLYEDKVRISVSNLDLNFIDLLPDEDMKKSAKEGMQDLLLKMVAPKFEMDLEMIYGTDGSNPYRLQAVEHAQSPINLHPVTGQPVWFCNMHNHSRYLRDRRPCTVPEVGMTDVYKGDLGKIVPEDVEHVNEVCEKNIKRILMQKGDVVLLDNYRVLHGRDVFKGERNHAVTWFESQGEPLSRDESETSKPDDFMNELINKTLV